MKVSVNTLGWTGALAPVATPLLDSAIWLENQPVLSINYNDTIEPYFNGDLSLNEKTSEDFQKEDVRDDTKDIEVSPRELSKTFLIPHGLYRQLRDGGLLEQYFNNMAKAFLESHLIIGNAYEERQLSESPIYGVLTACAKTMGAKNIDTLVEETRWRTPNIGNMLSAYNMSAINSSGFSVDHDPHTDLTPQAWGDMLNRLNVYFKELPFAMVVRSGSMALIGDKKPKVYTKFLPDKNLYEVVITWVVAGAPVNNNVGLIMDAPTEMAQPLPLVETAKAPAMKKAPAKAKATDTKGK